MPTKKSVEQNKYMRRRVRLYLLDTMKKQKLSPATVVRATGVDKSALSKFLREPVDPSIGLDNFLRLVRGLGLDVQEMIHKPHPKEGRPLNNNAG